MTGINALSDSLKGGNKLGKTSTQKGKNVADSSENAADIFAAILGSMNLNVTSKGQKSSIAEAGQEMEGMQIDGDSQQQPQKGDVLVGYGSLAFPLMTQFMLQGDIPAGKEANSGNVVVQGTGQLLTANVQSANVLGAGAIEGPADLGQVLANSAVVNADEVPQVSDESLATTGMVSLKSQSGNPAITELDKYKQVIAGLLEALSGEISSPQGTGTQLGLEKETVVVSQDVMKLFQGEGEDFISRALNQEGNKELQVGSGVSTDSVMNKVLSTNFSIGNSSSSDLGSETNNQDITKTKNFSLEDNLISQIQSIRGNEQIQAGSGVSSDSVIANVLTRLEGLLNKIMSPSLQENALSSGVKTEEGNFAPIVQENIESPLKQFKENGTSNVAIKVKEFESSSTIRQKPEKIDSQSVSAEPKVMSDEQKQNETGAIGVVGNTVLSNVTSGKAAELPVWKQISAAFHNQVVNSRQELKKLDIQLNPAELGKVHINLRWENGLVHLQVQASEASTGQALQNQLTDLRQNLIDQGVSCGTLQMGQDGYQQPNSQGDESRKMLKQNNNSSSTDEEIIPDTNPVFGNQNEINRINVTA